MKKFTFLLLLVFFGTITNNAKSQTVFSTETFPNSFNTGWATNLNSNYSGSTGSWNCYSNNSFCSVSMNSSGCLSTPNCLKLKNNLTTSSSSFCHSICTSPNVSCSSTCVSSVTLCFKLLLSNLSSANSAYTFYVEVSKDNGATWTAIYTKTAAELFANCGLNTWKDICVSFPTTFYSSTFKYRFRGTQNSKCGYTTQISIDDCKITTTPCNNLSLGNLVWLDANGNNVKDASEAGIANVSVKLYADANNDNVADGAAIATTTTNSSGNYVFTGLTSGNYIVGTVIPTGYTRGANATTDPDNNVDNDNNAVNQIGVSTAGGEMRSPAITLASGSEPTTDGDDNNGNQTLDIALCPAPNNLVLGNSVWVDTDGNGLKGATEVGLSGVTIKLYRDNNADSIADGASIASTTTSSTGIYSFSGLAAGKYIVGVTIPNGYIAVPFNDSTPDDNIDNDNNGFSESNSEFFSNFITLSQGDEPTTDGDDANGNLTLDFALQLKINTPPGGCPNGTFGEGFETGTFSTGGSDLHHGLPRNGSYQIVNNVNQLGGGGYLNIQARTGSYFLASHTSNNPSERVWYANIAVTPGKTYNFCTYVTLLKNLGDGANYILGLYVNGQQLDTGRVTFSWTSICGSYTVPAGVTSIELSIRDPKKGLFFVAIDDICITEVPANLSLGNLVWLDLNANNLKETFEPVIPNATVKLYVDANNDNIADGAAIRTTITNSNGLYTFSNLTAGNYIVGVTIPPSYQARINGTIDPDNNVDNDNNGVTLVGLNQPGSEVRSNAITLLQGTEPTNDGDDNNGNLTLDFGLCPLATNLVLGNLVWNDFDGDGKRDSNEPGIAGITVSVYRDDNGDNIKDTDAPFATTLTNTQGAYLFSNLAPGRYIVSIPVLLGYSPSPNTTTQATSPFPDNDVDNDNNGVNVIGGVVFSNAITLLPGSEPTTDGDDANGNLTLDMALCGNAFIGDFVWNDLNGNGIQDINEPGINGATVNLTFSDGTVTTSTTANFNGKDGYYDFKNLGPDTYVISFVTPAGLTPSPANQGSDDGLDSDPINGSVSVTLIANVSNFTIDAGFTAAGICGLGNLVFLDLNYNGIRDLSEPGIPGATVNLYRDSNGDNVPDGPAIATTTTITDGSYRFTRLTAGSYIVGVVLPSASYAFLPNGNATPNNNIDNDNNGIRLVGNEVLTNFITLAPGTEPTTDGDDNNINSTLDLAMRVNAVCRTPLANSTNSIESVETGLSVYPNPAVRNFNLSIKSNVQSFATIWIVDQSGRVVFSKNQMLNKGSNIIALNADNRMNSGVYTIQSLVNGKLLSQRIIVGK